MLGAIDHAISVVRQDRMAERVDNWTPTTPEVRVMTLEGGHAKTAPRQPPHPSRFHLRCLWRGTHKKEYVTSTDNSRLSLCWDSPRQRGPSKRILLFFLFLFFSFFFFPSTVHFFSLSSFSFIFPGWTPSPRGLGDTPRFEPDLFMRSPVYGYRVKQCYVGVYFGASPPPRLTGHLLSRCFPFRERCSRGKVKFDFQRARFVTYVDGFYRDTNRVRVSRARIYSA